MSRRSPRVIEAPLAVATDGSVVINAYWVSAGGASLDALVQTARKSGEKVFIGIAVPQPWKGRVIADLDELALDTVGAACAPSDSPASATPAPQEGEAAVNFVVRTAIRVGSNVVRSALTQRACLLSLLLALLLGQWGPANDNASKTAH